MIQKSQVIFIHGGNTFKTKKDFHNFLENVPISFEKKRKWNKEYFDKKLKWHAEIIKPQMPLKENAHYEDWKIYFERYFPFLTDEVVLVGNSLGGIFLAKYLTENKFPKKIKGVYLIGAPFENSLPGEDLVNGFTLSKDLKKLDNHKLTMMFSKNDPVVPIEHAHKYEEYLPKSNIIIYEDKGGHFQVEKFPELIKMIKKDLKR